MRACARGQETTSLGLLKTGSSIFTLKENQCFGDGTAPYSNNTNHTVAYAHQVIPGVQSNSHHGSLSTSGVRCCKHNKKSRLFPSSIYHSDDEMYPNKLNMTWCHEVGLDDLNVKMSTEKLLNKPEANLNEGRAIIILFSLTSSSCWQQCTKTPKAFQGV